MKVTMEFNLPEEDFDFNIAAHGSKLFFSLIDISRHFETLLSSEDLLESDREVVQNILDRFNEILYDRHIDLNFFE